MEITAEPGWPPPFPRAPDHSLYVRPSAECRADPNRPAGELAQTVPLPCDGEGTRLAGPWLAHPKNAKPTTGAQSNIVNARVVPSQKSSAYQPFAIHRGESSLRLVKNSDTHPANRLAGIIEIPPVALGAGGARKRKIFRQMPVRAAWRGPTDGNLYRSDCHAAGYHTYFFHAPEERDRRVDYAVEVLVKRALRREPPGREIERVSEAGCWS
jgi:hypothetical protein